MPISRVRSMTANVRVLMMDSPPTMIAMSALDWDAIDGVVDGFARGVRGTGDRLRHLQRNQLQANMFYAVVAIVLMVLTYVLI